MQEQVSITIRLGPYLTAASIKLWQSHISSSFRCFRYEENDEVALHTYHPITRGCVCVSTTIIILPDLRWCIAWFTLLADLNSKLFFNVWFQDAPNSIANSTVTVYGSPRLVLSINSWIIVQNKVPAGHSSTSFDEPWISYRNGFGDLSVTSNYWIGNEVIYGLVSTGQYKLRVEVRSLLAINATR